MAQNTDARLTRRGLIGGGAAIAAGAVIAATTEGIARADSPARSRNAEPVIDVRDAGAVGDGVADDSDAFSAAIEQLRSHGGGTLLVPDGRYRIDLHPIRLCDNLHINGSDGATMIQTPARRDTGTYGIFAALSQGRTGYGSGCRDVVVEGLTFTGSYDPQAPVGMYAFALHHAQDVEVRQCRFIEAHGGQGHLFDLNGCHSILISDCEFRGYFPYGGASPRTEAINVDVSWDGALSVADTPGSHDGLLTRSVRVQRCTFGPLTVDGVTHPCSNPLGAHAVLEGETYSDIVFVDNVVTDPIRDVVTEQEEASENVFIRGVIHMPTVSGMIISGNTFTQHTPRLTPVITVYSRSYAMLADLDPNGQSEYADVAPISSADITIVDNTFSGFRPNGTDRPQRLIWFRGVTGGRIRGITVQDNTFTDGGSGPAVEAVKAHLTTRFVFRQNRVDTHPLGVAVVTSNQAIVANNTFTSVSGTPIRISSVSSFEVSENHLTGDSSSPGILIDGASREGVVRDNVIEGYDPPIEDNSSGGGIVIS